MSDKSYVIVDIETTGLSREKSRITEIAAVVFDGNRIVREFQTLVNPQKPISYTITHLTGITNQMVANAPIISEVLPSFLEFLEWHILVAHNASFDYGFLNHNSILHLNQWISNDVLCTRKLANRLLPELPSKRLSCICEHFWVINQRAHRALEDVLATTEIFKSFLEMLEIQWIAQHEDILLFQNSKKYY